MKNTILAITWYCEPQSSFIRLYDEAFLFVKMRSNVCFVKVAFTIFNEFDLC